MAETPEYAFQTLEQFYDFNDNKPVIVENTLERIERNSNSQLVKLFIQGVALAYSYQNISLIDFANIRQLDVFIEKLTTQFSKVYPTIDDAPTASQLLLLHNTTLEYLDQLRLSVRNIIDVETKSLPLQLLVYQYNGNLGDYDQIVNLNSTKDVSFVEGNVELLTVKREG